MTQKQKQTTAAQQTKDAMPEKKQQPICKACLEPLSEYSLGEKNGYNLLACTSCGSVTVAPYPKPEELKNYYKNEKNRAGIQEKKDSQIERATRRIERLTKLTQGKRFLDVGCNYGYAVQAAKALQLEAFGIDIDDIAVGTAKKEFGAENFALSSIEEYAAQGKKADIIYTSEVIEHIHNPDSFIEALSKVMEPSGVLYLTTPDGNHFMIPQDFTSWEAVIPPEHIVYFSRKGIKTALERHGFIVKKFFFNLKPGIRLIATLK